MSVRYLAPILEDVSDEADNGRQKFGDQFDLTDLEWLAVLAEEFGEAAMHVTKTSVRPVTVALPVVMLRREVIQIAAVAARWVAALDRRQGQ